MATETRCNDCRDRIGLDAPQLGRVAIRTANGAAQVIDFVRDATRSANPATRLQAKIALNAEFGPFGSAGTFTLTEK